jgi:molecular chaperone DnaJ
VAEDYYEVLGVSRTATDSEIKAAYRKQARVLHPDANPGDTAAEERFKLVNRAYETLRDPERRRRYDMFGDEPRGAGAGASDPFGAAGGLGDIFDAFFGGGSPFGSTSARPGRGGSVRRGADAEVALELDFNDAVFGVDRELSVRLPVTCEACGGSGARAGTTPVTCSGCQGTGEIRRVRQSILGQMVTASPCPRCGGTGEEVPSPCPECRGDGRRTVEHSFVVEVPAGVETGQTLRLTGRGAAGQRGGPSGDLFVHLRVHRHATFTRDGDDLRADVKVSMAQAALGAHVVFETLDGSEELAVPPGTQGGKQIRVRGRGVPHLQGRGRGDLLLQVVVETPTGLTKGQEELLRQLAAERGEEVAEVEGGLRSRLRGAFK